MSSVVALLAQAYKFSLESVKCQHPTQELYFYVCTHMTFVAKQKIYKGTTETKSCFTSVAVRI